MYWVRGGSITAEGLRALFGETEDLREEKVLLGGFPDKETRLFYLEGLISPQELSENVIRPATEASRFPASLPMEAAAELMLRGLGPAPAPKPRREAEKAAADMLSGACALLFPGLGLCVTFAIPSQDKRSVTEPKEEKVVKGGKDAFVETLNVNQGLVRRRIRSHKLRFSSLTAGSMTNTRLSLVYLEGYTKPELVEAVRARIAGIKTEDALSSSVLAENITDCPASPFPQLITTERPDKFALNLLEGRVGILVDGLPMGFLLPVTFSQFMKAPEDNSGHFIMSSVITLLRYLSFVLSCLAPAFYVAVSMYHQEMIPSRLMQSMVDAKAFVPFPTAVEVIAMLLAFGLLQEAGLRLPTPVGQTVSIIGGLIVGQSAVEAKVVSPVVVVVVALSGIAGYAMPDQDMAAAVRLIRFLNVALAAALGMFGVSLGACLCIFHLASITSLGVPYMSPFSGARGKHGLRAVFRLPMDKKREREPELWEAPK